MGYLLDTHALIWWWNAPERLSPPASAVLSAAEDIHVSAVSGLEIAINVRIDQLPSMAGHIGRFGDAVRADGFHHLPMKHEHAVQGGLMPGPHRDPFDRVIAAQALVEDLTVITRDRQIAAFGCKVLW